MHHGIIGASPDGLTDEVVITVGCRISDKTFKEIYK